MKRTTLLGVPLIALAFLAGRGAGRQDERDTSTSLVASEETTDLGTAPTGDPNTKTLHVVRVIIGWVESHPWAWVGYVGLVVLVKILTVSRWDLTTASMLMEGGGLSGVAAAVTLAVLPHSALLMLFGALMWLGSVWARRSTRTESIQAPLICIAGFGSLSAALVPWQAFLIVLAFELVYVVAFWAAHGKPAGKGYMNMFFWTVAASFVMAAFISTVWMPLEKITVAGEQGPVVGYVISTEDDFSKILTEESRVVRIFKSEDIQERQRCTEALDPRPLIGLWNPRPDYELCSPDKTSVEGE